MYYVSSVKDKIGITDTDDGVTEFFSPQKVYNFLEKGIHIYGATKWNRKAECTVLKPIGIPSTSKLASVVKWCHEHYSNLTINKLEDFLAMCGAGTVIYQQQWEDGQCYDSKITKIDVDKWYIDCPSNVVHQEVVTSVQAAHHVIVYYSSHGELRVVK